MDDPNTFENATARLNRRRSGMWKAMGVLVTAVAFMVMSVLPAWAADMMTVTFIRHGESGGNASGLTDTSTPGPSLTELGRQQATAIANKLSYNNYDAIYASTMVRTQQTAGPMSKALGLPITVLPGLQEIEAGDYEGTPEASAAQGYGLIPLLWSVGLPQYGMPQDLSKVMPGTTLDGYTFDARVDAALQTMYDNGDRNAVVFSHGGAVMFWTLMNVTNISTAEKLKLMQTNPLGNTGTVVIEGNNEDGWTLVNWNGQQFSAEPTLAATMELQSRTLTRQLAAAVQQVRDAFATGNVAKVLSTIGSSVSTAVFSVQKYFRAVGTAVAQKVGEAVTQIKTNITNALQGNKTAGTATTDGSSGTQSGAATAPAPAAPDNAGSAAVAAKRLTTTGQKPAAVAGFDAKAADATVADVSDTKAADAKVADTKASDTDADAKVSVAKADTTVTQGNAKATKRQKAKAAKADKAAGGSHAAKHAAKHGGGAKKAKAAAAH
jgi:broad specificity phosphatase PhoE